MPLWDAAGTGMVDVLVFFCTSLRLRIKYILIGGDGLLDYRYIGTCIHPRAGFVTCNLL